VDFEAYAHRSGRALLRLATVLTGDLEQAQDVVQEVLVTAYRRWPMISTLPYPHAYVRRMVVNETVSWHRKWGRQVPRPLEQLDRPVEDQSASLGVRDELLSGISRLPGRQRAAVVLRYFEDMTDVEIAETLGCRAVTVRGYLHRGLRALRVDLEAEWLPERDPAITERTTHAH
jgi:RNA polymerase sigma-70 factor (sigma-E family)